MIFTVLGLLPVLMPLAAFAGNLTWIAALYFSRRFFAAPKWPRRLLNSLM